MAAKLPQHLHEQIAVDAYELDLFDVPQREITRRMAAKYNRPKLALKTVNALIQEERANRLESIRESADKALADFIDVQRWVARDAAARLDETAANAQNVPGLQNNILTASKNIATALGLLTSKGENAANITINLDELLQKPITVDYPDPDAS